MKSFMESDSLQSFMNHSSLFSEIFKRNKMFKLCKIIALNHERSYGKVTALKILIFYEPSKILLVINVGNYLNIY